ncbi:hypothetical protein E4T56_gene18393 [Termitomyces sp. T112]|nr:hypothetical protein E4T56_gene18393 [Termitomyces sp. T112]
MSSKLASQFEKITMAHAFLNQVDCLLSVAHALLAKDPCLAAPVNPSLEFLLEDLMVGIMVSAPAVASASNTTKHLLGALAVAREEEQSKGHRGKHRVNHGDIREAGPLTLKIAAGSIAKELATLLRVATTLRSKEKGKGKAQEQEEEEEEEFEEQIEETFSNKCLATLLCCKEGEKEAEDVEMRKTTPLAMVAEVKPAASNMEVKGKEFEAGAVGMDEDEDKGKEEANI